MQTLTKVGYTGLALAATLALVPADATAQAQRQGAQECTARVSPSQAQPGESAVRFNTMVSAPVGRVTGVNAEDESGIQLAEAGDLPAGQQPITQGEGENNWVIWLDLSEAEPGSHELTLTSSEGECTANITVQEEGGAARPGAQPQPGAQPRPGAQPGQPQPGGDRPGQPGQPSGGDRPGQPGQPSGGDRPGSPTPGGNPGGSPTPGSPNR